MRREIRGDRGDRIARIDVVLGPDRYRRHGFQRLVGQLVERLQIFAHRPRAHPEHRVVDRAVIGLAHRAHALERPALRDEAPRAGDVAVEAGARHPGRSEEHTSELQSLMRISYAVFCLKKKKNTNKDSTYADTT